MNLKAKTNGQLLSDATREEMLGTSKELTDDKVLQEVILMLAIQTIARAGNERTDPLEAVSQSLIKALTLGVILGRGQVEQAQSLAKSVTTAAGANNAP